LLVLSWVEEYVIELAPLLNGVKTLILLGEVLILDDELLELIIFGFLFLLGFYA
jgi:hypothetical protein